MPVSRRSFLGGAAAAATLAGAPRVGQEGLDSVSVFTPDTQGALGG